MHVLIAGGKGQLGRALHAEYARQPAVMVTIWDRPEVDITDPATAGQVAALAPDLVINAAAWTNVDAAQANPGEAYAVNALGPKYLAEGCARCGAPILHVSTNEVFPGQPGTFYREYDLPGVSPTASIYARSKLAGEHAITLMTQRWYIVRLAWLFGPGTMNFPSKIVTAADQRGALTVVDDEFGNPTYAPDAAAAMVALAATGQFGIYHLVNEGFCSRFDFAREVLQVAGRGHVPLSPIPSSAWPRPTTPPPHAVLVNQAAAAMNIVLRPWQAAVQAYVGEHLR